MKTQRLETPWRLLRVLALGLLIAALALAAGLARAADEDPPGRVGRLADLQGSAWLWNRDTGEWVAAERNAVLTTGDRIATDANGRAELRVGPRQRRRRRRLDVDQHACFVGRLLRLSRLAIVWSGERGDTAQARLGGEPAGQRRVTAEHLQVALAHAHAGHRHLQRVHRAHPAEPEQHGVDDS